MVNCRGRGQRSWRKYRYVFVHPVIKLVYSTNGLRRISQHLILSFCIGACIQFQPQPQLPPGGVEQWNLQHSVSLNLAALEKYNHCRDRMFLKNPESAVEKDLFHGTSVVPPDQLYLSEHGFDSRLSSRRAQWGTGTYFTSGGFRNLERGVQSEKFWIATPTSGHVGSPI